MPFLRSLFAPRRPLRHFALLDADDRCLALHKSQTLPGNGNWVEIHESRLSWLDAPLPASARVVPVAKDPVQARPLTA